MSSFQLQLPAAVHRTLLPWGVLAALTMAALTADLPPVRVKGRVERYEVRQDLPSVPDLSETAWFEVVLDGKRCSVTAEDDKLKEQWMSDGVVSYETQIIAPKQTLHNAPEHNGSAPLTAKVLYGPHPLYASAELGAVWLAFAPHPAESAGWLDFPAFWRTGFTDPYAHALRLTNIVLQSAQRGSALATADVVWSLAALDSLPERQQRLTLFRLSIDPREVKAAREELRARGRDGEVEARYRAVLTTNYAGWMLPAEFRFELLSNHRVRTVWRGFVHDLAGAAPLPSAPALSQTAYVRDYRFVDVATRLDEMKYVLTNNAWLDTNDLALKRQFDTLRTRAALTRPRLGPTSRHAVAVAVVLAAMIAFPLLVRRRSASNTLDSSDNP
jgi:hypothetical protein